MAQSPQFFETPQAMRSWLQKNHATTRELHVGYYKAHVVAAGRRSITWQQSVAEALCFGWIDGIRRTIDEDRYAIRFTPRRPGSRWSEVNIRLVGELEAAGKMTEPGRAVFRARRDPDSQGYKAQKKVGTLDAAREREFKKHKSARAFFASQPPGYQKKLAWWVMQAKQDETRHRRLLRLIEVSANQRRLE
jgi:uncharacterized protein YdeI (YjbR/CyaY-like superfamily)